MTNFNGKEILDSFVCVAQYLVELYNSDISIAVCDKETYLAYEKSASYKMAYLNVGDKVKEGSSVNRAMQERKKITAFVPKETSPFGVPYQAVALPIFDNDHAVIGAVGVAMIMEKEQQREDIINQFVDALDQVNLAIEDIAAGSQNLATISENLFRNANDTSTDVKKSNDIIAILRRIADDSKMLGLNASIEAARVGEKGRGFSIIAQEIYRMSEGSRQSANQVIETLQGISRSIDEIHDNAKETSAVSSGQAAAVQEILASMEELKAQIALLQELLQLQ